MFDPIIPIRIAHTINFYCCCTLLISNIFEILHVSVLMYCTFNGNLTLECVIRPLFNKLVANFHDTNVNAVLLFESTIVNIYKMSNMFYIPPDTSNTYISPLGILLLVLL